MRAQTSASSELLRHSSNQGEDLLLRETIHRCGNDLQLIVSLLALKSRRAESPEIRQALTDVMDRVSVLARARTDMSRQRLPTLEAALCQVCEALHAQAEPRSIMISLQACGQINGLSSNQITTLALVVNELATNAIKHAFPEEMAGHVRISIEMNGEREVRLLVEDDGVPLRHFDGANGGLGLGLVKGLLASIDGLLILPKNRSKIFEIRVETQVSLHRSQHRKPER